MTAREITVEDYLRDEATRLGGYAFKLVPVSWVGLPDRLILLPGAKVGFLELKRKGKEPTDIQHYWLKEFRRLGFSASWADSKSSVDTFLEGL